MKYLLLLSLVSCAHLTAQDKDEIAQYSAEQSACVVSHHGDKAAIDACRAQVKATWDARWNQRFDGGFGTDEGGH